LPQTNQTTSQYVKIKPRHPIKDKEESEDSEVVQKYAGGGIFNYYTLLMTKSISTTNQASSRTCIAAAQCY